MRRLTLCTSAVLLFSFLFMARPHIGGDPAIHQAMTRVQNALFPRAIVQNQPIVTTTTVVERMRELKVPGVSMAVFRDGRIEWTRGWGVADVEGGHSVDRETLFQAASISKPVAAAVVLALVAQGRISLDADVNGILTSWKLPFNRHTAAARVTLRSLLTHSAGTTVHGFRGYARGESVPTLLQLLDGARPANSAAIRVDIPVGSRWRYSGGGFAIVQLVVEDVTKKPFADAARELVLQPFGMGHSTYVQPLPASLFANAASGYRSSGGPIAGRWHTYPEQAAAGLWTTPEDLARFAIELQKIAAGHSNTVMSQALAQEMLRRQVGDWGLGVGLIGQGAAICFGHSGGNEGFRAIWLGCRGRASGVVVMTNSDAGSTVGEDIIRTIAGEYGFEGLVEGTNTAVLDDVPPYQAPGADRDSSR